MNFNFMKHGIKLETVEVGGKGGGFEELYMYSMQQLLRKKTKLQTVQSNVLTKGYIFEE